jgi:hypothetical protein
MIEACLATKKIWMLSQDTASSLLDGSGQDRKSNTIKLCKHVPPYGEKKLDRGETSIS